MKRLTFGLLFVALAAVLAAGCGGGGSKALSKEEFGAQLEAICADYDAKQKEIGSPNSLEEVATKGPQILDEFDKAIAQAEKLKAPDELKSARDEFFAKSKEQRDLLKDLVSAAKDGDGAKVQEIGAKIDPIGKEVDALGKELGAPSCAD